MPLSYYHIISRYPWEVNKLFDLLEFLPQNPKQPYLDAWNIKRLYGFAQRRQKDSERRGQTPRDPLLCYSIFLSGVLGF